MSGNPRFFFARQLMNGDMLVHLEQFMWTSLRTTISRDFECSKLETELAWPSWVRYPRLERSTVQASGTLHSPVTTSHWTLPLTVGSYHHLVVNLDKHCCQEVQHSPVGRLLRLRTAALTLLRIITTFIRMQHRL